MRRPRGYFVLPGGRNRTIRRPDALRAAEYRETRNDRLAKRALDIVVSAFALTLAAPLILVVALLVRTKLGAPALFVQMRPGLAGAPFPLLKFRSMIDTRAPNGALHEDSERLPPFGVWLRSTSLDELPELWNVLVGDMSLVGPRPLLMEYLPLYNAEQARRHEVKPGVTGWAQVNGRNDISWEDRFRLDVWYVDHRSFSLDLKILALSLVKILKREGITHEGEATMPRFLGSGSQSKT